MTPNAVPGAPAAPARGVDQIDLLARRDVVVMPLLAVLVSSLAFIASQLLRTGADALTGRELTVVLALSAGMVALCALGLLVVGVAWNRLAGRVSFIAGFVGVLTVQVAAIAILDGGLASADVLSLLPVATYVALILPGRWAWSGLAATLVLVVAIGVVGGIGAHESAGVLVGLIVVSFLAGRLPRRGHERAVARSSRLARSDELTGVLNRRGFVEQADHELWRAAHTGEPVALALIDLDGFKRINDREGHAAGDRLLAWVGGELADAVPAGAFVGRTGGDEFAVLLPGHRADEAVRAARMLHGRLARRVGASIGVALAVDGAPVERSALLQAADVLLYRAKGTPLDRIQAGRAQGDAPAPAPTPTLTFDELRATGGADAPLPTGIADQHWVLHGHLLAAVTGALVIGATWLWGPDTFWADWLRWSGLVWIGLCAIWAYVLWRHQADPDRPAAWLVVPAMVLTGIGIMDAALADGGGITAPAAACFFLAIVNIGSVARPAVAMRCTAILGVFWVGTVVLGPASVLWAVPFVFALLVSSATLGRVASRVLLDAAQAERHLAAHDALTGVLNRRAFAHAFEIARGARPSGAAGYVAVDLDDFKRINDRFGHAAGDRVLVDVAATMQRALGDGWTVGRIGGDEFVAFTPDVTRARLTGAAADLDGALIGVAAGSVGFAQFGRDGRTLGEVAAAADRRSYARKLARRTASATQQTA